MKSSLSALFAVVLLVMTGCSGNSSLSGMQDIEVALADLQFAQAGLLEQEIGLELRLSNPNPIDVAAQGLRFDMELDNAAFARGLSNQTVSLPPLSEVIVPVTVRVPTVELIDRLITLSEGEPIDYSITGLLFLSTDRSDANSALPFAGESLIRLPDFSRLLERFGAVEG